MRRGPGTGYFGVARSNARSIDEWNWSNATGRRMWCDAESEMLRYDSCDSVRWSRNSRRLMTAVTPACTVKVQPRSSNLKYRAPWPMLSRRNRGRPLFCTRSTHLNVMPSRVELPFHSLSQATAAVPRHNVPFDTSTSSDETHPHHPRRPDHPHRATAFNPKPVPFCTCNLCRTGHNMILLRQATRLDLKISMRLHFEINNSMRSLFGRTTASRRTLNVRTTLNFVTDSNHGELYGRMCPLQPPPTVVTSKFDAKDNGLIIKPLSFASFHSN